MCTSFRLLEHGYVSACEGGNVGLGSVLTWKASKQPDITIQSRRMVRLEDAIYQQSCHRVAGTRDAVQYCRWIPAKAKARLDSGSTSLVCNVFARVNGYAPADPSLKLMTDCISRGLNRWCVRKYERSLRIAPYLGHVDTCNRDHFCAL